MTGWELRIWRKSMLWSREKAAREFGVTQKNMARLGKCGTGGRHRLEDHPGTFSP